MYFDWFFLFHLGASGRLSRDIECYTMRKQLLFFLTYSCFLCRRHIKQCPSTSCHKQISLGRSENLCRTLTELIILPFSLFLWGGQGMNFKGILFLHFWFLFLHGITNEWNAVRLHRLWWSCRLNDNISTYWDRRSYTFNMENEWLNITHSKYLEDCIV